MSRRPASKRLPEPEKALTLLLTYLLVGCEKEGGTTTTETAVPKAGPPGTVFGVDEVEDLPGQGCESQVRGQGSEVRMR